MNRNTFFPVMLGCLFLTACSGGPKLFWSNDENTPVYAQGGKDSGAAESRVPLDIPPQLREEISVPMPDQVALDAARGDVKMSAEEKKAVAGKAVSLDTRLYEKAAPEVFSAVIDGMTSLNLPVESVDSPSGTITTAWVRKDSSQVNSYIGAVINVFGGGGAMAVRYRFIVRVYRMPNDQTQVQIRTLGQVYTSNHWVYKQIQRKVANEVFSATEERLGSLAAQEPESAVVATPTAPEDAVMQDKP